MKTKTNFKMPKYIKYRMATIANAESRNQYKRMMIDAIIHGEQTVAPKEKKNRGKAIETEVS